METKQAIVLPSGWEAQVENTNEIRPLTQYHTPGAKVTVREVMQYEHGGNWIEVIDTDKIYGRTRIAFEVVSEEESKEQVSEQAPITLQSVDSNKEAVESWGYMYDLKAAFEAGEDFNNECRCGVCSYCYDVKEGDGAPNFENWSTNYLNDKYGSGANHILQSGEYVKVSDVDKVINDRLALCYPNEIHVLEIILKQLTTLKTNK